LDYTLPSTEVPSDILPKGSRPLIFLVGAGISSDKPSWLPTAIPFIKPVLSALTKPSIADAFYPSNRKRQGIVTPPPRFEFTCQLIKDYLDPKLELLECYASNNSSKKDGTIEITEFNPKPNFTHFALADFLLAGHYVFTTNFDNLIEDAFKIRNKGEDPNIPTYYSMAQYYQVKRSVREPLKPGIYKLHGSLYEPWSPSPKRCPETLGVTLDKIRYEKNKEIAFRWALEHGDLYVMGYSGSDEFDILPMMASAKASDRRLIWIIHRRKGDRIEIFGGSSGRSLAQFNPTGDQEDQERSIKDRLQLFIRDNKRCVDKVFLVHGPTRYIFSQIYLDVFHSVDHQLFNSYQIAHIRKKNFDHTIKAYVNNWALKKIDPDPLKSKLAAIEFMWVQNVERFYDWALTGLRKAITKKDPKTCSLANAIADKYESWAYWFRGEYKTSKRLAEKAQQSLLRLRPQWGESRDLLGELALEALIDAYQCCIETHSQLDQRAAVEKVVSQVDKLKTSLRKKKLPHRVKKVLADIFTVRANDEYSVGKFSEGYDKYADALRQYKRIGEQQWVAYALGGEGDFFRVTGQFDYALKKYKNGYETIKILGGAFFEAWYKAAIIDLQRFYPDRNLRKWIDKTSTEDEDASVRDADLFESVNSLIKEIKGSGDIQALGLAFRWRGDLARQRTTFDRARRDYERSQELFKKEETPRGQYGTGLCQLALKTQEGQCSVSEIEKFKRDCKQRQLDLEAAHCDLILAEIERLNHGRTDQFARCLETYEKLSCYWGQLMALLGCELNALEQSREIYFVKSNKFAKDHNLTWAYQWIRTFKNKQRLEFYFPLFN